MAAPPIADRPVTCREIEAKTVTRLRGTVDPWFLGRYGMNLYRGCEHGCAYCDGRAERYYVEGDFARDIAVKRNALQVLRRELPSQVSSSWAAESATPTSRPRPVTGWRAARWSWRWSAACRSTCSPN